MGQETTNSALLVTCSLVTCTSVTPPPTRLFSGNDADDDQQCSSSKDRNNRTQDDIERSLRIAFDYARIEEDRKNCESSDRPAFP